MNINYEILTTNSQMDLDLDFDWANHSLIVFNCDQG